MSLTQDDLRAIGNIVEQSAEDVKLQTAAGFAEVHEKFAEVHDKINMLRQDVNRVEDKLDVKDGKLENTVHRVDQHDTQIKEFQSKFA